MHLSKPRPSPVIEAEEPILLVEIIAEVEADRATEILEVEVDAKIMVEIAEEDRKGVDNL